MVDPKMFTHSEGQPEGFNVFYWCDDGAVKGTKMVKLDGKKTINDYGLDKNSVLYLKYKYDGALFLAVVSRISS